MYGFHGRVAFNQIETRPNAPIIRAGEILNGWLGRYLHVPLILLKVALLEILWKFANKA
jgi:hypothetical protein